MHSVDFSHLEVPADFARKKKKSLPKTGLLKKANLEDKIWEHLVCKF